MSAKMTQERLQYELRRLDLLERKIESTERQQRQRSIIRLFIGATLGVIVGWALYFLFTQEVPPGNRDVVIVIVSALSGAFFGSVISYYFGDSDNAAAHVVTYDTEPPLQPYSEAEEVESEMPATRAGFQEP